MIFLTVGTQFPFDRLARAVDEIIDEGLIDGEVFAQIGESSYKPRNFESVAHLEKDVFDNYIREASGVIGHAGMGTISMAMEYEKPLLVVPRQKRYGEVVNDHQVAIARKFEELGHLLAAYEVEELEGKIHELKNFVPRKRQARPEGIMETIDTFLQEVASQCTKT